MGLLSKITTISLVYGIYQIITKNEYAQFRKVLIEFVDQIKPSLSKLLDYNEKSKSSYFHLKQDDEQKSIDQQIEIIRSAIERIDSDKIASTAVVAIKNVRENKK